jgi:hypothetical protein
MDCGRPVESDRLQEQPAAMALAPEQRRSAYPKDQQGLTYKIPEMVPASQTRRTHQAPERYGVNLRTGINSFPIISTLPRAIGRSQPVPRS